MQLGDLPEAATQLAEAAEEILACADVPETIWQRIQSDSPLERRAEEVRRRAGAAGIFPDRTARLRLVGAVPAEHDDGWTIARR